MTRVKRDFLVEIGTEELPPTALRALSDAFVAGVAAGLEKAQLAHAGARGFATPRRLAVYVKRLAAAQPEQHLRRRGPPLTAALDESGAPTRAARAFAESCGTSVEALARHDEGKGTFLFFVGTRPGQSAMQLLPGLIQTALEQLPIPRRMHWGAGPAMFVRPVHWVVMLFGRDVVPATLLDTVSGRHTRGHRFHAPRPIALASPASYERTLGVRGFVVADFAARRERIRAAVGAAAAEINARALVPDALLDEVTGLTEWPVALAGHFEERFLSLPREVLISTLSGHQRCFALEGPNGGLLPAFVAVSNIESREPERVRAGNERVVRPRLADAAFFWEQDRRRPLAAREGELDSVTFQAKLGSLGDKMRRVRTLAGNLAAAIESSREDAERAARLCKCDLLTALVGEFPELQGVMGSYYAQADGESQEVAVSIREHYLPRGAGDELPATRTGISLAIADKLDTLAGIFAIGEKPTGTKDPFALRRAALGVQRILIEKQLDLDLLTHIGEAVAAVRAHLRDLAPAAGADSLAREVYDFLMERLRAYYLEGAAAAPQTGRAAVTTEMFDAVLATHPRSPLDFDARLRALSTFLDLPESGSLTAANKRIANILRKANAAPAAEVDVLQLRESAEVRLFDAMCALRDPVAAATAAHEYAGALGRLAQLRPAVDAFFDQVLVMDENPRLRANRLSLLAQLQALFAGIADLSRLPG
ncbi:MAG: glycine--tRNA ligase subunit beta [Gammaproteobacteria bacterium]|nr:glycine--tRNA ligase subunit beta [Gammaproteobacteria bacterium]